jgi:hypothetical protein
MLQRPLLLLPPPCCSSHPVQAKYYEQLPNSVGEVVEAAKVVAGSAPGAFDVPPLRTWGWWGMNQVLRGLQIMEWGLQALGLSW